MIDSVKKALDKLRDSSILFADQDKSWVKKDGIDYGYIALTEEALQTIESLLNEQVALQDRILSIFETSQDAASLIQMADQLGTGVGSKRFDYLKLYELTNAFLRSTIYSRGGSFGHKSLLERDGTVTTKDRTALYIKYDEFVGGISAKNNQLSAIVQQLTDFSFDPLLSDLGYSSLDQFMDYIKKYSEVRYNQGFDDFVVKTQYGSDLKFTPAAEDLRKLTYALEPYLRLDMGSVGLLFLKLAKGDIDNIASFVRRHKIDIIHDGRANGDQLVGGLENPSFPPHMYRMRHSVLSIADKLTDQFFRDLSTSYREGIFSRLQDYLMTNIIDPKVNDLFLKAQNREKVYKLDSPDFKSKEPLTLDSVKDIVIGSLGPSALETRGWNTPNLKSELRTTYYAIAKGANITLKELSYEFKLKLISYLESLRTDIDSINASQVINAIDKQIGDSLSVGDIEKLVFKGGGSLVSENIMPDVDRYFNKDYIEDLQFAVMKRVYKRVKGSDQNNLLDKEEKGTKEEREAYDNEIVDLKTVLSPEDIRLISFIVRSHGAEHSFKAKGERIEIALDKAYRELKQDMQSISNNKSYFARSVPTDTLQRFFGGLKKTLLGQLKQEEAYLQGRSDSLGITADLMADGKKIFDSFFLCKRKDVKNRINLFRTESFAVNPITGQDQDDYVGSHELNPLKSAAHQIALMMGGGTRLIANYFRLFPEDAVTFFSLDDQNSIKAWLIRIINFVGVSDNAEKIKIINEGVRDNIFYFDGELEQYIPVTTQVMYAMQNDLKRDPADEPQCYWFETSDEWYKAIAKWESKDYQQKQIHFLSGQEFLTTVLKDLSGSKKERLEKMDIVAGLLHDFGDFTAHDDDDDGDDEDTEDESGRQPTSRIIVNSKYFSKMYNRSLSDAVKAVLSIDPTDGAGKTINWIKTLNHILVANPTLIPPDYLSETMTQCVSMLHIKDSADLDSLLDVLVKGNLSESVRKLKFIAEVLSQYATLVKYMAYAKPKEKEIFAPNISTDRFRFRVLGDLDPYHFTVGIDTDCCQAIGNAGESAAIDSFINPEAGVLILDAKASDGSWKMVAQSYFHFAKTDASDPEKAIILDNIETGGLGKSLDSEFYRTAYAVLGQYLKSIGFDIVGCGISYTQAIGVNDFRTSKLRKDPRHFEVNNIGISPYTDFSSSQFFDLLQPKFSFDMPDVVPTSEGPMPVKSASLISVAMIAGKTVRLVKIARLMSLMLDRNFGMEVSNLIRLAARSNELPE